eukprot:c20507_g1_i1.p1 GENE.c20507_g1_i1~~c20507_g1_i1.p1  ORF type:complete len:586 (+),score=119.11 c20507_g1_i1:254-2011(+)
MFIITSHAAHRTRVPLIMAKLSIPLTFAAGALVIAFWVFFFPKCAIHHPVRICDWLGLSPECLPAIASSGPFDFALAHWLLAAVLWSIGSANLIPAFRNYQAGRSCIMTLTTSGYAIITGFFAVFRAQYGLGKPLLIGAALHNLAEWSIAGQISRPTYAGKVRFITAAALWITIVCIGVALAPSVFVATIVEQSVGITMDFLLFVAFFELAVAGKDDQVKEFYFLPFVAVAVHLFLTILPLVFANFVVGQVDTFVLVNEVMIYISAIITHSIYYVFSVEFDAKCHPKQWHMDQRFMATGMRSKFIFGFAMGLIPLIGVPYHTGNCPSPEFILGTTAGTVHSGLGDAFAEKLAIAGLAEKARSFEGNLGYELFRNVQNPDEFRFVERWESVHAVEKWLSEGPAHGVFQDPVVKQLLQGGGLGSKAGYRPVHQSSDSSHSRPSETRSRVGGIYFEFGSECASVWRVISDWSNCSWVVGCTNARVHPDNSTLRDLFFGTRKITENLDYKDDTLMELKYTLVSPGGYSGVLALKPPSPTSQRAGSDKKGCAVAYRFVVDDKTFLLDDVYHSFLETRVPHLQKMFDGSTD